MDIAGFGCEMSSDPGGSYDGLRGERVCSMKDVTAGFMRLKIFISPPPKSSQKGNKGLSALRLCFFLTARGANSGRPRTDGISSFASSKETPCGRRVRPEWKGIRKTGKCRARTIAWSNPGMQGGKIFTCGGTGNTCSDEVSTTRLARVQTPG